MRIVALAQLADGALQASVADLTPEKVSWPGPLSFQRVDGWTGDAQGAFDDALQGFLIIGSVQT